MHVPSLRARSSPGWPPERDVLGWARLLMKPPVSTMNGTKLGWSAYFAAYTTGTAMSCHNFLIGKGHTRALRPRVFWEDTQQPVERGSECRATHSRYRPHTTASMARSTI